MKAIMKTMNMIKVSGERLAVSGYGLLVMVALLVSAPTQAQFQQYNFATAPQASFQSTSSMVGTGSAYSSTPMLNDNGTATYNGPHKAKKDESNPFAGGGTLPNNPQEPGQPIGDAVLPLLLCALVYAGWMVRKRYRSKIAQN